MKYSVYNYGVNICYECDSIQQTKTYIKQYVSSMLEMLGLKNGIDYHITLNHLFIKHAKCIVGRIMISLRETFPVFNFYWKTPRQLVWF